MKSKPYEIALVDYHVNDDDTKEIAAISEWFFVDVDDFTNLKVLAKRSNGYAVISRMDNQIVEQQLDQAKKFRKAMKRYEH